jgi:hypothetical protein
MTSGYDLPVSYRSYIASNPDYFQRQEIPDYALTRDRFGLSQSRGTFQTNNLNRGSIGYLDVPIIYGKTRPQPYTAGGYIAVRTGRINVSVGHFRTF